MQHLLFFDTETNGLPVDYNAPIEDLDNWPRLVELAWQLWSFDRRRIAQARHIVRPDGWEIPKAASDIHGITQKKAMAEGDPIDIVVSQFATPFVMADTIVAHNTDFDRNILGAEILRLGFRNIFEDKPSRDTMKESADWCKLPGRYGYKWPKLQELHAALFLEKFDDAHSAMADVAACAKCFFELIDRGIIPSEAG